MLGRSEGLVSNDLGRAWDGEVLGEYLGTSCEEALSVTHVTQSLFGVDLLTYRLSAIERSLVR